MQSPETEITNGNLLKLMWKNSWNHIRWTYFWRFLVIWNLCGVANATFDVEQEDVKVEEREMKIENADPIPIDESVLKPWRVNMKKQSSSIDEKGAEEAGENRKYVRFRAWVSTGATGACRTRRNSEHHLRHPRILKFSILTSTRRAHSMQQVAPSISNS